MAEFVELLDSWGSDEKLAQYGQICMGHFGFPKDSEAILRLWSELGHTSPFEFAGLTFHVKCPIYVARQWFRHRTFKFLERSGRYTIMLEESTAPKSLPEEFVEEYDNMVGECRAFYAKMLNRKVPKEIARTILPVSTQTDFIFSADLRNLFHFIRLRTSQNAQELMRAYAQKVLDLTKEKFPLAVAAFERKRETF